VILLLSARDVIETPAREVAKLILLLLVFVI
jgi:hypothetical protein